ncbi:unnamed protein product, partial [marine sediment metagenome]
GAVLVAVSFSLVLTASAQKTWDKGGSNGNWDEDSSWSPAGEPTATDDAIINNGATVTVNLSGEQAKTLVVGNATGAGHLEVNTGGVLDIQAGNGVNDTFIVGDGGTGTVVQTAGTVRGNWNGNPNLLLGNGTSGNGTYTISGGTLDSSEGNGSRGIIGDEGVGELNVSSTASVTFRGLTVGNSGSSADGTINQSGGTVNASLDVRLGVG